MKKLVLILVAFTAISLSAYSQTKEQTKEWIKKLLVEYGNDSVSVTTCTIKLHRWDGTVLIQIEGINKGEMEVGALYFTKGSVLCRVASDWNNEVAKDLPEEMWLKFQKTLRHLLKFCKEERANDLF